MQIKLATKIFGSRTTATAPHFFFFFLSSIFSRQYSPGYFAILRIEFFVLNLHNRKGDALILLRVFLFYFSLLRALIIRKIYFSSSKPYYSTISTTKLILPRQRPDSSSRSFDIQHCKSNSKAQRAFLPEYW